MALVLIVLLIITGCAPTQQQLSERAQRIAQPSGLAPQAVATQRFTVMTYARIDAPRQPLRVYLEGDGKAWITRTRISLNPTPHDPLALRLAALDTAPNVVYIARPCQYVSLTSESHCNPHLWSQARYSPEIVEAIHEVISHFVDQSGHGSGIELVGYSGGGALAVLVALKREDVTGLRTVAANLDIDRFSQLHQVAPMKDSLNPTDFAAALQLLPQRHYVGGADPVVPEVIARSYWQAAEGHGCVEVRSLPGVTHSQGWRENWSGLLSDPLPCAGEKHPQQTLAETTF